MNPLHLILAKYSQIGTDFGQEETGPLVDWQTLICNSPTRYEIAIETYPKPSIGFPTASPPVDSVQPSCLF